MACRSIAPEFHFECETKHKTKPEHILVTFFFRDQVDVKTARTSIAECFYYVGLLHRPQACGEMILKNIL